MKYFRSLFILVLALMVFIPVGVLAEESYENFDFKVERKEGEKIKDTEIKIYASDSSNPDELTDRTNEFDLVEVMWSICVDDCSISEEVADDATWEDNKEYVLMIRISAKNKADINVWGTDKAKYNGTPIEELDGEYGNTGNELMIKTRTSSIEEKPQEIIPTITPEPEKKEETADNNKCLFGLPFCCTTFLGLSICIWVIIILVLIILIVSIFMYKAKKRTDEQLAQL